VTSAGGGLTGRDFTGRLPEVRPATTLTLALLLLALLVASVVQLFILR
jgi:hypothetical protein